ncbi:hypothetical protein D9Q98_004763 [Chlorella vulgaris]|uniref:CBM20 domain-containing protein n=1 Tax=Chlorella vulgaris TaxID=3077 RepID=A0A9D4TQC1_CHLVU|nr:hypothetical protein D9Q98_004763 [Chlorella vulgaris]
MQACVALSHVHPQIGRGVGIPNAAKSAQGSRTPARIFRQRRRASQGRTALHVAARVATAPTSAEPTAAVTLKACRRLAFGQVLKVVGGTSEMGDWDPNAAPIMTWSEGDVWFVTLDIPAGRHEFKVVVDNGAGSYEWEAGPNRSLQVLAAVASSRTAFTVSCDEEPGAAAMAAANGNGYSNGNGNGGNLSLATALLRIEGYVADGIISKEEASSFSADQLDFLIRKRTKDRKAAAERKNGGGLKSPAAALSRWAGLMPASEDQQEKQERRRLEEERAQLERKQEELLAKAAAARSQSQSKEQGHQGHQGQQAQQAQQGQQRSGGTSKWAQLREHQTPNGTAQQARMAGPNGNGKQASSYNGQRSSNSNGNSNGNGFNSSSKPAFPNISLPNISLPDIGRLRSKGVDWKSVAGVTGAIAAGAGAVFLAAGVDVAGPDGNKHHNALGQGLDKLGLPSIDSLAGKVGEWTSEQRRMLSAVQPPAAPPSDAVKADAAKAGAAKAGAEKAAEDQRKPPASTYAPLSVSPEMNALRAKSFAASEAEKAADKPATPAKPAAAATTPPKPAEAPKPAAAATKPAEAPKPAAAAAKPAEAPKPAAAATKPAEAPKPAAAATKQAEAPKPAAAATKQAEAPKPAAASAAAPKQAPAAAATKAEAPKQAYVPMKMSAELEALKRERFGGAAVSAATPSSAVAAKPAPAPSPKPAPAQRVAAVAAVETKQEQQEQKQAGTQSKAAASKAEASKAAAVGAKSKDDAKAKDGSSSSSDSRAFNTALFGAGAAAMVMAGVLGSGKDLGSLLRFRPMTDKELAELRAKELAVAKAELEMLKQQLRKERAEAAARLRAVQQQQQQQQRGGRGQGSGVARGGLFGGTRTQQRSGTVTPQPQVPRGQKRVQVFPGFASMLAPLVFLSPSLLLAPSIAEGLSVTNLLRDPEVASEVPGELPASLEDRV